MVGYHRETHHFSEEKSTKEFTAPQHTRFILPPIHPTKSSLRCVGGIFLQIISKCNRGLQKQHLIQSKTYLKF